MADPKSLVLERLVRWARAGGSLPHVAIDLW
jgi:hypothetical protein